jgi:hypothetical protein
MNILSCLSILVKSDSYGKYVKLDEGTNIPHCAIMIERPTAFMRLLFPAALRPYNSIPSMLLEDPNSMSFGT